MIPYGHQNLGDDDIEGVLKVLKSDWLTQGPKVLEFEKKLADYCGSKYAVVVSHGTAGLQLAYLAAGLGSGDEVVTTPNSFVATTNMMMAVGAKPIFCDIRADTWNIDEDAIEDHITSKTKAIVPVHFAGQPCEMEKIHSLAQKYNLVVIEDACHALGAKHRDKMVGALSDMTVFSFHPVKSITTAEGGAVLTDNKEYYDKLVSLRNHGISKDEQGKNVMNTLGYNFRMNDVQAALGINQLDKLDGFVEKRHQVVEWYKEELGDRKDIILPTSLPHNHSSWHLYVIRVVESKLRDSLLAHLKENEIGANFHYPAIYSHPYYRESGYDEISLRNEDEYDDSCITLPCHTHLEKEDIKYIARVIDEFFNKYV